MHSAENDGRPAGTTPAWSGGVPRLISTRSAVMRMRAAAALALLAAICLSGCGGCGGQDAAKAASKAKAEKAAADLAKKKKEEAEKPQPDFEIGSISPLLSEGIVSANDARPLRLAKPGHWTTTVQSMRANKENFEGRTTSTVEDARGRALPLPHTLFAINSSRPAILAKGRTKRIENELLTPADASRIVVRAELSTRGGAVEHLTKGDSWAQMPSYQYFVVVLAKQPTRYAFLKVADAVRAPYENDVGMAPPHYRVVLASGEKQLPLPANALTWTSVAYVVWDEVNLARMEPGQQQALVDWIHWGGRLIINGPDSLASLRNSFLQEFLPADPGNSRTVSSDDLAPLAAYWGKRSGGKALPALTATRPWSAIELTPRPGARPLPGTAGLFYERGVGSGSIVVSAVQLAERDLVNWQGFDGFLNGALLRRASRVFRVESDGAWTGLQTEWAQHKDAAHDAHFTTPVRWFSRDAGTRANVREITTDPAASNSTAPGVPWGGAPLPETRQQVDRPGGLGAWNEFGPVSTAARDALREAAGVRVPAASFVIACLAVYLVVLVPLNWMMFHAVGRVEWAWIAAPVIALLGTVGVVRLAQLDIGFVRAQTEIALLELQGDLPRGHLSRYTALYSSLSTTYDVEFEDDTAVAAPFPRDASFTPRLGDAITTVSFEKYDQPRLRGLTVSSASTEFVQSEQMYPLAGPVRMSHPTGGPSAWQMENRAGFDLSDAVVIHRRIENGRVAYRGCWLGVLRNNSTSLMPWAPLTLKPGELPYAAERKQAAAIDYRKRLPVDELLKLAFRFPPARDPFAGSRDEYRLVARLDEALPGAATTPSASQTTGATVIVGHFELGPPPPPQPDVNSPRDVGGDGVRGDPYDDAGDAAGE